MSSNMVSTPPGTPAACRCSASTSAAVIDVDDVAVLHDVVAVGDGGGEVEVLLDQQDGEAALLRAARMISPMRWTITGARPSVGSSSSRRCAPVRRMRPIASICCSPPDSLVPWLRAALLQVGEELVDLGQRSCRPAAPSAAAAGSPRRSGSRRCRAPPGSRRAPAARSRRTAGRSSRLPSKRHRAGALLDDAHDRVQGRGLAGAVAAEQRHQLAAADLEVDAMQDVRFAVPGLQAARLRAEVRSAHDSVPT